MLEGVTSKNLLFISSLSAFFVLQSSPNADVACGQTITGKAVLTEDLVCSTQPGLTLQGPADLDLNGHAIICAHSGLTAIM